MTQRGPAPLTLAWPPRPPRRLAGVPLGVLGCWISAVLLLLSNAGRPLWYVAASGLAVLGLAAVSGWRRDGHWSYQWMWLRLRYHLRPRVAGGARPAELSIVDFAARLCGVSEVEVGQFTLAVLEHESGCTGVLELSIDGAASVIPRLPSTLTPPPDADGPSVSVQLIVHTRPIPAAARDARAWLAVQARRGADHTTPDLRVAVAGAVRRLLRHAGRTGLAVAVLDPPRLREALHAAARLDLARPRAPTAVGTERWRAWWTGDIPQRCLRVRSWPGLPGPPSSELYQAILAVPTVALTLSVAVRRVRPPAAYGTIPARTDAVAVEVAVRVAERDRRALRTATRQLFRRLGGVGVRVERLEGRQREGLAATLPLGGFVAAPVLTRAGE